MTTIRVPPIEGAVNEKCVTTILDSQGEGILLGMKGRDSASAGNVGNNGKQQDDAKSEPFDSPPPHTSRICDAIILVYDATVPSTFTRLTTHWLPLIESVCPVPVVVAGNKVDLLEDEEVTEMEQKKVRAARRDEESDLK